MASNRSSKRKLELIVGARLVARLDWFFFFVARYVFGRGDVFGAKYKA